MSFFGSKDNYGITNPKKKEKEMKDSIRHSVESMFSFVDTILEEEAAMLSIIASHNLHFDVAARKNLESHFIGKILLNLETAKKELEWSKGLNTLAKDMIPIASEALLSAQMFASVCKTGNFGKEWPDKLHMFEWFEKRAYNHIERIDKIFTSAVAPLPEKNELLTELSRVYLNTARDKIGHRKVEAHRA